MNPYYTNWSYGYTLAPANDQSRGAYTSAYTYTQQQPPPQPPQPPKQSQHGGANQANLTSINSISSHEMNTWSDPWTEVKSDPVVKTQPFVTSSNLTLKQEIEQNIQLIGPVKPVQVSASTQVDPTLSVAKLHELAMSNKLVERYETLQEPKSDNAVTEYSVQLFIGTETYEGKADTLKLAKQNAALQALANTKYRTSREKKLSMFTTARRIGTTATSELHEVAAKKGLTVDFKFLEPYNFEFKPSMRMWHKKDMLGNYRVQLNVAGYEFYGQAELPQQAKHNASTQALEIVRKMPDPSGAGKVIAKPGGVEPDDQPPQPVDQKEGKNTTMMLNEIAVNNGCTPEWTLISESGPAHAKLYTWQLTIGEFSTVGTGPSKKIAKQGAADQMMAALPEEWKKVARRSVKNNVFRFGKRKGGFMKGPQNKK